MYSRKLRFLPALLLMVTIGCAAEDSVLIPAGSFIMGSNSRDASANEKPAHQVFLDAYRIDLYEVSVASYFQCVRAGKCKFVGGSHRKYFEPQEPIRRVSWYDAVEFCAWKNMRLPTEAEWEKAARGPKNYINPWGNRDFKKGDAALMDTGLLKVGQQTNDKSDYGVYDMAGNVSEWVSDWYSKEYYRHSPQKNPAGPESGDSSWKPDEPTRIVRGSNFRIYPVEQASFYATSRWPLPPESAQLVVGFRCARSSK